MTSRSTRMSPAQLAKHDFDNILLIKPSSLGDIIHALPVLAGLRRRYPRARIDWLVAKPFAAFVAQQTAVNDVIVFDRQRFGRLWRSPAAAWAFLGFLSTIRRRRYNLVIDLQGLFRSGLLAWNTRANVRIGFEQSREGARFAYTHRLPSHPVDTHAVDRNYAVADLLGFAEVPLHWHLAVSEETQQKTDRLLAEARNAAAGDGAGDHPLVAIAPGARWETKRWLPQRYAATTDALAEQCGARCVLLGSPDERQLCEMIATQSQADPLVLAGRTSIAEMAAVINRADLLICHDSAAMHVAVALRKPLVCITGPTNPQRTGPYRRAGDVIRLDLDCSPCYLRTLRRCPNSHRCMRDLSADMVTAAVLERLERHASVRNA